MHAGSMTGRPNTAIICIGNDLIADDAVGCKVYERLSAEGVPPNCSLHLLGVGGMNILDLFDESIKTIIIVDAVQFGAPVGTVHDLRFDDLPIHDAGTITVHDVGVVDAMKIGKLLFPARCPDEAYVVGIEGRRFNEVGEAMSEEVSAAIGDAIAAVHQHARQL